MHLSGCGLNSNKILCDVPNIFEHSKNVCKYNNNTNNNNIDVVKFRRKKIFMKCD